MFYQESLLKGQTCSYFVMFILLLFMTVSCSGKEEAQGNNSTELDSDIINNIVIDNVGGDIKVTFIELGSVKCVPCKAMVPIMDTMRRDLSDQVDVLFYDVWTDEGKPYGQKFNIRVIPTQIFLDENGKEYFRHEGFFPMEELYSFLEEGGVTLP
jgi:thioredoxin